jgi:hypothetical protein
MIIIDIAGIAAFLFWAFVLVVVLVLLGGIGIGAWHVFDAVVGGAFELAGKACRAGLYRIGFTAGRWLR